MNRLWVRLSLAFSAVILGAVILINLGTVFLIRNGNLIPQLTETDNFSRVLEAHYRENGSWDNVGELLFAANSRFPQTPDEVLSYLLFANETGVVLFDPLGEQLGQRLALATLAEAIPIRFEERVRGYLLFQTITIPINDLSPSILPFQLLFISLVSIAGFVGIVFGILLSRSLSAPLAQLEEAVRAINRQNLSERVTIQGTAEVLSLASAFNEMVDKLEKADTVQRNLLADVAHEFRTPLSVLRANLQAIHDGVYPLSQEEISILLSQTELLQKLIEDLHQLAQADAKQLELHLRPLNLGDLSENVLNQFKAITKNKSIELGWTLPEAAIWIEADAARLSQVLHNLLQNAYNYTEAGGEIRFALSQKNDFAEIRVQDTGIGIAPEKLGNIFERFYRLDASRTRETGGAGLGLAIAKAILELHGGSIQAHSTGVRGEGTEMRIHLPLS